MPVELEWRFEGEHPPREPPEEEKRPRARWPLWLGLGLAILALVGFYAWWHARHQALTRIEAEVQAVAQLELRALVEGDTELYLSLQDDTYPIWWEAQRKHATLTTLLPPPLPSLSATTTISLKAPRVVGDVARVEVVRMAGLPGEEMAPFRAVRFYRRSDDGRWLHTRADPDYAGYTIVFSGPRLQITCFAIDEPWIEPLTSELESIAEQFCSLASIVPCQHRVPLALDFTGTLDTVAMSESVLPAPFVVGVPADEAARAMWEDGMRELLFDRLIAREVGDPASSALGEFRGGGLLVRARLYEWLRAKLGLREPLSPDLDLVGEALDTGKWIPLSALWEFAPTDDDPQRPLAEAEIDLLLAFVEEEYGPSGVVSLLHALRKAQWMEALIAEGLEEAWPIFEYRYIGYVRDATGRSPGSLDTIVYRASLGIIEAPRAGVYRVVLGAPAQPRQSQNH